MTSNAQNGFILLEVLVAMSLILGVWMTSIGAYQSLILRFAQQESRRMQLRQSFDTYEHAEQARANKNQPNNSNVSSKGIKNESSRVSGRNRAVHTVAKPTAKN